MIRRLLDFIYVLIFVWAFMLLGLWLIDSLVVPWEIFGLSGEITTGILKVTISAALALVWLWTWREIVKRTFWRAVRAQKHSTDDPDNALRRQEEPETTHQDDEQ